MLGIFKKLVKIAELLSKKTAQQGPIPDATQPATEQSEAIELGKEPEEIEEKDKEEEEEAIKKKKKPEIEVGSDKKTAEYPGFGTGEWNTEMYDKDDNLKMTERGHVSEHMAEMSGRNWDMLSKDNYHKVSEASKKTAQSIEEMKQILMDKGYDTEEVLKMTDNDTKIAYEYEMRKSLKREFSKKTADEPTDTDQAALEYLTQLLLDGKEIDEAVETTKSNFYKQENRYTKLAKTIKYGTKIWKKESGKILKGFVSGMAKRNGKELYFIYPQSLFKTAVTSFVRQGITINYVISDIEEPDWFKRLGQEQRYKGFVLSQEPEGVRLRTNKLKEAMLPVFDDFDQAKKWIDTLTKPQLDEYLGPEYSKFIIPKHPRTESDRKTSQDLNYMKQQAEDDIIEAKDDDIPKDVAFEDACDRYTDLSATLIEKIVDKVYGKKTAQEDDKANITLKDVGPKVLWDAIRYETDWDGRLLKDLPEPLKSVIIDYIEEEGIIIKKTAQADFKVGDKVKVLDPIKEVYVGAVIRDISSKGAYVEDEHGDKYPIALWQLYPWDYEPEKESSKKTAGKFKMGDKVLITSGEHKGKEGYVLGLMVVDPKFYELVGKKPTVDIQTEDGERIRGIEEDQAEIITTTLDPGQTVIVGSKKTAILKQKKNKNTGKTEWALVSKTDPSKVLKWFGVTKPSEETVAKEEKRVQYFKNKAYKSKKPVYRSFSNFVQGKIKQGDIITAYDINGEVIEIDVPGLEYISKDNVKRAVGVSADINGVERFIPYADITGVTHIQTKYEKLFSQLNRELNRV